VSATGGSGEAGKGDGLSQQGLLHDLLSPEFSV
jgi:hypothetical protein